MLPPEIRVLTDDELEAIAGGANLDANGAAASAASRAPDASLREGGTTTRMPASSTGT